VNSIKIVNDDFNSNKKNIIETAGTNLILFDYEWKPVSLFLYFRNYLFSLYNLIIY
jgi:hypothetical protein